MIRQNQLRSAAVLIIVLIGLVLRLYRLDAQSFWYDEGNSARIAERSMPLIIEGAAGDIHPPLYYVALHFWRAVAGDSEFGLRLLSAACGTLLILFTYLLGTRLVNPRVGLIAALLTAFSPFEVYYSQEARMYIMLALLAAISTWALAELGGEEEQRRRGAEEKRSRGEEEKRGRGVLFAVGYVLATAAGLYTQYAYPFVMVAQGVCVVLWLIVNRQRRWRNLLTYAAMNIVAMALFIPWLPIAVRQITSWGVAPQPYDVVAAIMDSYRWLVAGRTLALDQVFVPLVLIALITVSGLGVWLLRLRSRNGFTLAPLMLFIMVALPFTLLFIFNLYREAYLKFLLVCVAPLMLLAAYGISSLFEWLRQLQTRVLAEGAATFAVVLVVMLPSLNNLYHNPSYARDDYRGIARMLEAGAQPDDAILFNAPNQWEVFTYYHRTGAPAIPLIYRPVDDAAVRAQLEPIADQYARLFVLYYGERESDPTSRFERWLAENIYLADMQWVGNIRLATYASHPPTVTVALSATFGTGLRLESVAFDGGDRLAGDVVPLRLQWRADVKPASRYKVFVHIGAADAPPVAQNDAEPLAGFHPTDSWNAGEVVVDRRAVWLKPGVATGRYGVYIGVYDALTGRRLPVSTPDGTVAGDRFLAGEINIVAGR